MQNNPQGPLSGVKVLDLSSVISGPIATQILADFGADVIKIEPPHGDSSRFVGPSIENNISSLFLQFNRNKRSVSMDLKSEEGKALLKKMLGTADVLVENFRPGVMQKLGLGYEQLSQEHPELVYASISGFGDNGPLRHIRCYDSVIQALGGFSYRQGDEERPQLLKSAIADKITGYSTAHGIMGALLSRGNNQGGQHVQVSMLDAYMAFMWQDSIMSHTFVDHSIPELGFDPHLCFPVKDGWATFMFVQPNEFKEFFGLVNRQDLVAMCSSMEQIIANGEYLVGEVAQQLSSWSMEEIVELCKRSELPIAPLLDFEQAEAFKQVESNAVFGLTDLGGKTGSVRYLNSPVRFSGAKPELRLAPQPLGAQTRDVLRELSLSDDEIESLIRNRRVKAHAD